MTLPCGCEWISPGTVTMCAMHYAAPELLEKCIKMRDWLHRLAANAESLAKDSRFETIVEASRADARNYRATAEDLDKAIAKATKGGE